MTKIEVGQSRNGKGLFAIKKIKAGETALEIRGKVYHYTKVLQVGGTFLDNTFRYSREKYLSPEGEFGMYANHSCEPNTRVEKNKGQLSLVALTEILPGQEITFDYSTIIAPDDTWTMKCNCGTAVCRKVVKKYSTLPKSLLRRYLAENIIPKYMQKL